MPLYDTRCLDCGALRDDVWASMDEHPACPDCGGPTVRRWTRTPVVHPDTYAEPVAFTGVAPDAKGRFPLAESRSEYRRLCREHGLVNHVEHTPNPKMGTDKAKHTTRWI